MDARKFSSSVSLSCFKTRALACSGFRQILFSVLCFTKSLFYFLASFKMNLCLKLSLPVQILWKFMVTN